MPKLSNGITFSDLEWQRNTQWHETSHGLSATVELLEYELEK